MSEQTDRIVSAIQELKDRPESRRGPFVITDDDLKGNPMNTDTVDNWQRKTVASYQARIFIAGSMDTIKQIAREYCYEIGLCVSIKPVDFIYTGGEESGAEITLINYPRFPSTPKNLKATAEKLTTILIEGCCQHSASIICDETTLFITRRVNP